VDVGVGPGVGPVVGVDVGSGVGPAVRDGDGKLVSSSDGIGVGARRHRHPTFIQPLTLSFPTHTVLRLNPFTVHSHNVDCFFNLCLGMIDFSSYGNRRK